MVAGKVGIGTTTPGANLEIAGHSGTTTMIVDGKDIVAADFPMQIISNSTGLTFGDNNGNTLGRMLRLQDLNQGTFYDQGIDGSDNYFLEVGNSNQESLVMNPNGNVGINTTMPSQALEVSNGNLLLSNSNSNASQLQLQGSAKAITTFAAGAQDDDINYILPTTQGSASTVLTNDGSGNLSWADGRRGLTLPLGIATIQFHSVLRRKYRSR